MHVADIVLGPIVWNVPRSDFGLVNRIKRQAYCKQHASKLRMFFLGLLAADREMSPEDKAGYFAWLEQIDWATLLGTIRDKALWKGRMEKFQNPIDVTIFDGINSEYQRLFRCYQMKSHPRSLHVV